MMREMRACVPLAEPSRYGVNLVYGGGVAIVGPHRQRTIQSARLGRNVRNESKVASNQS